jgi:ubiquinone/menaquinone biosynthesis C-methylase UbiE
VKFQTADAESLPFEDGQFDAVVGNFVLHHVSRPEQVLREVFRVLRSGGKVALTVWADLSKLEAFGVFLAAVEKHAGPSADLPHGPLFGISDFGFFQEMMRNAGFRDSSVRELPIAWRTASVDPYIASFRAWANLEAFPDDVRNNIEVTISESIASYRSGHVFVLPNPALLIAAMK